MSNRIENPHRKSQNRTATLTRNASVLLIAVLGLPAVATAQWTEDFDSYTAGTVLDDVGGWFGWNDNPNGAGTVSDIRSRSGPHSIVVSYRDGNDAIRPFTGYTSGVWSLIVYQFIPSSLADMSYFVLNNEYNHGGPYTWAIETHFDPQTGMVNENIRDSSGANALPIIYDAWIEIATIIDLNANTVEHYYDGQLLVNGTWAENGGPVEIANLNLYAPHNVRVFYDDLTLNPPRRCWGYRCGDANCDGTVSGEDIEAFFMAINDPAGYARAFPNCDMLCTCDINRDCHVDEDDIVSFFMVMNGGVPCEQIRRGCRWYYGLKHCPLGDDECFDDDGSGNLLIYNLGSGGEEGAAIHLGDTAEGLVYETELDPAMPVDAVVTTRAWGIVNGSPNQWAGSLNLVHANPGLFLVWPDFAPIVAFTSTVQIFDGGSLVHEESGVSDPWVGLDVPSTTRTKWGIRRSFYYIKTQDTVTVLFGTGSYSGDLVIFRPEDPGATLDAFSQVDLVLEGLTSFTVFDESLLMFSRYHYAAGSARMESASEHLTVSNIGSSGADGVSIDLEDLELEPTDRFKASLEPVSLASNGAGLDMFATGSLGAIPGMVLGNVGIHNIAGTSEISADFSVFGSPPAVRVEVYDDGVFVGTFFDDNGGVVASLSSEAQLIEIEFRAPESTAPFYALRFDRDANIRQRQAPGLILRGDLVRLLSDRATGNIDSLTQFDLTAMVLESFTITGETELQCTGGLCGDANCDGMLNGADVDAFFVALADPANWIATYPHCTLECVADINRDNAVNGADIDAFFLALGNGSCP